MTNSGRYWEVTGGHHANYSVDILLDPELHASFCRRGRRRLKEIQMSSRAQLKFDRQRGVLRVGGSEAQVAEVQRQLECLGGPRKQICTAAWTELMRTRMSDDANGSVVLRIQQLSSCRVHIERTSKEVRLFGPKPGVAAASQLLDDLQQLCIETLVEFDESQDLTEEKIQQIAQQECVTIKFDYGQDGSPARATILGFEFAVSSALRALEAYEANPMVTFPPQAAEKAAASIAAALAKLSLSDESSASSSGSTTKVPAEDSDSLSEGAEEKKEDKGNTKQEEQGHAAGCSCPTCGATNFCVSCGSANEQYQMYAMQMKAMQMGGQMMMPAQGMVPNMEMAAMPGQVMVMPMNQMMAPMQGIVQPNMQPMGQNMGMVNANMMQAVCMPMQMQGASPEASGDGQVYFVPAQMVPQSMMGDGQKQSFCM